MTADEFSYLTDEPAAEKGGRERAKRAVGLYAKFKVARTDDPGNVGRHRDCRYFVLDPQHDPIAFRALEEYADLAGAMGYGPMAVDINTWLDGLREQP